MKHSYVNILIFTSSTSSYYGHYRLCLHVCVTFHMHYFCPPIYLLYMFLPSGLSKLQRIASTFCVSCKAQWHLGITFCDTCLSICPSVCLSVSHTFLVVTLVSQSVAVFRRHAYFKILQPIWNKIKNAYVTWEISLARKYHYWKDRQTNGSQTKWSLYVLLSFAGEAKIIL